MEPRTPGDDGMPHHKDKITCNPVAMRDGEQTGPSPVTGLSAAMDRAQASDTDMHGMLD